MARAPGRLPRRARRHAGKASVAARRRRTPCHCPSAAIPLAAGVRVHDDGRSTSRARTARRARHVPRIGAVDADRDDRRGRMRPPRRLPRSAGRRTCGRRRWRRRSATRACPGWSPSTSTSGLGLVDVGDGLDGEQVGLGVREHVEALAMEVHQLRLASSPYRPRYSDPSCRIAPYGPTLAATRARRPAPTPPPPARPRAGPQCRVGVVRGEPGADEARTRHLVARADDDVRPGGDEVGVRPSDRSRVVQQGAPGPQQPRRCPRPSASSWVDSPPSTTTGSVPEQVRPRPGTHAHAPDSHADQANSPGGR